MINKKKVIAAVSLLFVFCGCEIFEIIALGRGDSGKQYNGDYPELYSIAVNSVLGTKGYILSGRQFPPRVRLIEEDSLGRAMFLYFEYESISSFSLIISQKSDSGYAWYYPDYNFISISEPPPPAGYTGWDPTNSSLLDIALEQFSNKEIEKLKNKNDWNNTNIDIDKCEKVKIVRLKAEGPVKKRRLTAFYKKALGDDANPSYWINFFARDDYNRSIYVGFGKLRNGVVSRHVVMLFQSNGSYDEKASVMELTDLNNYQDDLKAFKERNNWNVKP